MLFLSIQHKKNEWAVKMATVEKRYGAALALTMQTERAIMNQYKRLPGLKSSNIGLDVVTGRDEEIDFEDILNGIRFDCATKLALNSPALFLFLFRSS